MTELKKLFAKTTNFSSLLFMLILIAMMPLAACSAVSSPASNRIFTGLQKANEGRPDSSEIEGQTDPRCRSVLNPAARQNQPGSRGELPPRFPVPDDSVLCGFDGGRRVTVFLNSSVKDNTIAQFYRNALAAQGFALQLDNPAEENGRYLAFGRGASEAVTIEIAGGMNSDRANAFYISYAGAENPADSAPPAPAAPRTTPGSSTRDCGRFAPGTYGCAAQLQMDMHSWQFVIEQRDQRGRLKTFKGERVLPNNNRVVIHVTINGVSRKDDGEWWYRLGSAAGQSDNGYRVYYKENGAWTRIESPPDDMGDLVAMTNVVSSLLNTAQRLIGTETINGQNCNHFHYDDSENTIDT